MSYLVRLILERELTPKELKIYEKSIIQLIDSNGGVAVYLTPKLTLKERIVSFIYGIDELMKLYTPRAYQETISLSSKIL